VNTASEPTISVGDDQRIKQLQSLTDDLRCWEVRRWHLVDGWTRDGAPLPPRAVWAAARQLYQLDCPAVAVPDNWPHDETYLEIGAFGYGCLRLTGDDGLVSVHPVNEYSRRFRLPWRCGGASATLAPIRDRQVGLATVGDRWAARIVQVEPDVDTVCRILRAVWEVAKANERIREELLQLAEAAVAMIRWPSGSADYVSRVSHLENHQRHWFEVSIRTHPEPLTSEQRASLHAAAEVLANGLRELKQAHGCEGSVKLIGYAHTDLEWLWPEPVSAPAVVGQFAGALGQLARLPEYTFGQAGSYLYSLLERHDPQIFADLVGAVAAGRWEPLTGMWVEPDANMLSGESLTRQLLHGQAYYQAKFGVRAEVCWLPDTFGFSGALPQLLAGSGISYFFTTRLAQTDVQPHHGALFRWEGIDGSRLLAFAATNPSGYQCAPSVRSIRMSWQAYPDSGVYRHTLQPLGYANGIGPTDDDLADARVIASLPGIPETRFTSVRDFFTDADRQTRHRALPVWRGELFMEAFRGIYTTQGRTKVLHRRAESSLGAAEVTDALRVLRTGAAPQDMTQTWCRLLSRQTHDIISGTCVGEIHAAAERDFTDIAATAVKVTDEALAALGDDLCAGEGGTALLLVNPTLSWRPVRAVLPDPHGAGQPVAGGRVLASAKLVPPLSALWGETWASPGVAVTGPALENDLVRVVVTDHGFLGSVYDKRLRAELLAAPANTIRAYLDRPFHWDAWGLAHNYEQFPLEPPTCVGVEVTESGPYRASVRVTWRFRDSRIEQDIRLWAGSARVDFATRIDWHERRVLLRTYFPTVVHSDYATYECAYGVVHRPTQASSTWDRVRFETPAHRFVDLSNETGGVTLLNDGRYGHHVRGGELSMSLLRSPVFPDPYADEGEHVFQYALYLHPGDWLSGGVLAEASDLNCPLPVVATSGAGSGVWRPITVEGVPLALGTLKGCEMSSGLVLRAYEPAGRRGRVTVTPPPGWAVSAELNLLEDIVGPPDFTFGPHQIRTWSIDRADR
jgi:alpha-mannosidase